MDDIQWQDPPPIPNRKSLWIDRLAPLIDQPGRWALVNEAPTPGAANSQAVALRSRRVRRPPGKWEFAARACQVYARYIGPD